MKFRSCYRDSLLETKRSAWPHSDRLTYVNMKTDRESNDNQSNGGWEVQEGSSSEAARTEDTKCHSGTVKVDAALLRFMLDERSDSTSPLRAMTGRVCPYNQYNQ